MAASFSQSIEVSHARREEQLRTECKNEGIELVCVQNVVMKEVNSAKAALGSTITSLVGGKAGYDYLKIYTLSQDNQIQFFCQPFSGITPLPGQHFKVIPVSIKNPIQYRIKKKQTFLESLYQTYINRIPIISAKKIRVCEWLCMDSAEQNKLKSQKLPFLRDISHVWQEGLTKIELEWTFQANAIDQEYTLVTLQTGRYGMMGEKTGLKQFKQICSFVSQYGKSYSGDGSNNVMLSNTYLSSLLRENYLSGEQESKNAGLPVWKPQNAVRAIIANLLKFEKFKRVYLLQDLDEKKMNILKEGVLNKFNIAPAEVIAAASLDTFGGMKNAAIFTKDKVYIADLNYEYTLNLSEVKACNGLKGLTDSSLELVLSDGVEMKLQVGLISDFMKAFFEEYCKIKL